MANERRLITEVALTESERCMAAIIAASGKVTSLDSLKVEVQRAVDAFKDHAVRIENLAARRGAVADLVGLMSTWRRDNKTSSKKQRLAQLRALDLANPLITELCRGLDAIDGSREQGG